MFEQTNILIFIHVLSIAIGLGGSIFQAFLLPIILRNKELPEIKPSLLARSSINIFAPISFGALAIIVFTGTLLLFNLNDRISNISSPIYLNVFFIKILLVTAIFSVSGYQTFFLRFVIVTMNIKKINEGNLPRYFRFSKNCSIINIVLVIIAIFLGIVMRSLK